MSADLQADNLACGSASAQRPDGCLVEAQIRHDMEIDGMSWRLFWRWLLLDEQLPQISQRPLWQYLLFDWAVSVLALLAGFAIAAAIVRHYPLPPLIYLIMCAGTATLVRLPLTRRRWRRIQARVPPTSAGTDL
jgi:hypothetical protein